MSGPESKETTDAGLTGTGTGLGVGGDGDSSLPPPQDNSISHTESPQKIEPEPGQGKETTKPVQIQLNEESEPIISAELEEEAAKLLSEVGDMGMEPFEVIQPTEAPTEAELQTLANTATAKANNDDSESPSPLPPLVGEEEINKDIGEKASLLKEHDVLEDEIAQADKIKEDLKQELSENDGWVKILGNDSLLKKVIKEGVNNKRPLRGEICTVRLEGRLQSDESVFESVESMTFQLGDAEVIPGLDLAVPLMCKGEISTVKVASRFGYNVKGMPPVVPSNADLVYEVELLDFEIEKELEVLSAVERGAIGIQKRERGNWWYCRDEASLAIQCYRRALEFFDHVEGGISFPGENAEDAKTGLNEGLKELLEERLKTYNNMAAAQLKLQAYDAALKSVENVLKCQPNNSKALFRKGKIHASKNETDLALEAFKRVSELEPGTKAILQEISQLQAKRKKEREGEKALYQRMFKGTKSQDGDDSDSSKSSSSKSSLSIGLAIGGVVIALAGAMAYRYRLV